MARSYVLARAKNGAGWHHPLQREILRSQPQLSAGAQRLRLPAHPRDARSPSSLLSAFSCGFSSVFRVSLGSS